MLYKIDRGAVLKSIERHLVEEGVQQKVRQVYVDRALLVKNMPLKIAYIVEQETITLVSVYPLKKERLR